MMHHVMMCQASRDVNLAVSMSFVEDVSKSMLSIIAVELVRRLTQYLRLAWIERTTTYRSRNDNFVFNDALVAAFVFLLIEVTVSTEKEARRQVYINILIQAAVCSIPYCFLIHPKLIAEGKFEIFEKNSIGGAIARQFFSFVENAVNVVGTDMDPLNQSPFTSNAEDRRLKKYVILCPSPKFLVGQVGNRSGDIRDDLELIEIKKGGDAGDKEVRKLHTCSNIAKVDRLIRREMEEEAKLEVYAIEGDDYQMTGKTRTKNFSVMSWSIKKESRDFVQTIRTHFCLLDNRPLNQLVQWFEHNNGVSFEDFEVQFDIYVNTLGDLIEKAGLADKVYLHRFDGHLSQLESLKKLEKIAGIRKECSDREI